MTTGMIFQMVFMFAGGVALFLLGMKLLTDGMKIAAGNTLRNMLAKYTSTMAKGIAAGIVITALVQSSSAIIFATIGFVNAGLMSLLQAVYVILGSNVGTTLTGWIVATVGFNVNLQQLAMPVLAVGMLLWLVYGTDKKGALGQALVGFALFFMGIDVLKNTFEGLGEIVPFDQVGHDLPSMLLMLLIGILLTTLMQSSSAAIAVVLTAVAAGLVPVHAAAALVIGADVGTTSTALFAVLGATSNAKRAAIAHVLFNLLKVPVAFPFIGIILSGIYFVFGEGTSTPVVIAIFHTTIKLIGLFFFLPFTSKIVNYLNSKFTEEERKPETTRYLDDTVLHTPSLAVSALIFELKRVGRKTRKLIRSTLKGKRPAKEIEQGGKGVEELAFTVGEYIQKMQQIGIPNDMEIVLPQSLRVLQYFSEARGHAIIASKIPRAASLPGSVNTTIEILEELMRSFMKITDSEKSGFSVSQIREMVQQMESSYEIAKNAILQAGSKGDISIQQMVDLHEQIRNYRRIWDQLSKAAYYLDQFNQLIEHEPGTGPQLQESETDQPTAEKQENVTV